MTWDSWISSDMNIRGRKKRRMVLSVSRSFIKL
jgi:hypothetical protein